MKQGSAEWLEWRRHHVGASDQTHLHWASSWAIGWKALWDIKTGIAPEVFQNPQMERGLKLEDEARLAYCLHKEETFIPALVESKQFPYLSASLDAWSDSGAIAEIKCPGKEDHELATQGKIPLKYLPQLCHQLFVSDQDRMDYVSFDGKEIRVITYKRDEKLVKEVMNAAHRFWGFVLENKRPDGEWPHPFFDTRIPIVDDKELLREAEWNYSLRERVNETEKMLEESNQKILKLCDLPRAKVGKLTITTTQRPGAIDYSKVPQIENVDLEAYRKPGTTSRSIRRS